MKESRKHAFAAYDAVCDVCGFDPDDKRQLDVHHRDMDETNNDEANLQVLCHACHIEAHRALRVNPPPGRLLTIRQAADALGVGQGALRRWADAGKVPCVRTLSGQRRFEPAVIDRIRREMGFSDDRETC